MDTINGLPAHILLVHAVVVLLPLASVLLVLTAVWPAARRHLALANVVLSLIVLVLIPITTDAGEWLERNSDRSALIDRHAELGDTALLVAIPVAILAVVIWWRGREIDAVARAATSATAPDAVAVAAGEGTSATAVLVTPAKAPRRTVLAPQSTAVGVVIAVLAVVAGGAAIYDTYRIGDSGAQATWGDQVTDA